MNDATDFELQDQFTRNNSEAAFAVLVQRYIALVHSVALRHTDNPQHAQDITQAVFIILARKAGTLGRRAVLAGWLYHTAWLTAANYQRAEMRRVRREQEAFMQSTLEETAPDAVWCELSPQLDAAMACLGPSERDALVLRYFQNKSMAEVGKFLGLEENAAQKRVGRALEKLRKYFSKRGIALSAKVIAGVISANSVQATPAALAKSVTAVAVAKGAASSASTLTLIKGALKIMAWTKAKMAIVVSVGILVAAGTTTLTVKEIQEHRTFPWQVRTFRMEIMDQVPPQVRIVPAKFPPGGMGMSGSGKLLGLGQPLSNIFPHAYRMNWTRTVSKVQLPPGNYDFIANLPQDSAEALQRVIERKFGLVAKREVRETDVLALTVLKSNAPSLRPPDPNRFGPLAHETGSSGSNAGHFECRNNSLSTLANFLESRFQIPVVDRTGLTQHFNIDLKWEEQDWQHQNNATLRQALLDQLGLELAPSRDPVEMLVVEKAN